MNPKVITTAAGIETLFQQAGAATVQAAILQPAETLLDLYGEDIRARAYVTSDPLRGEQMLRPDFTCTWAISTTGRGFAKSSSICCTLPPSL